MALKPRDVVLAIITAFVAWGFLTHWIRGLRLVGYAFVTGCSITVVSVILLILTTSRRSWAIDGVQTTSRHRAAGFLAPGLWKAEVNALRERSKYTKKPLYPTSFLISDAIDALLELILQDFVTVWFKGISPNPNFPNEVDKAIRAASISLWNRVEAVDVVEVAVSRIVPIVTDHLKGFYEAERAVRGKNLNRNVTESEELDLAIAAKYRDGKLHPAASTAYSDTKLVQQEHMRTTIAKLLPEALPEADTKSRAVMVLVREIVACAVLFPIIQMLSDPDTLNQLMEAIVSLPWFFLCTDLYSTYLRAVTLFKIEAPSVNSARP
jgi:sorting nexin-25